MPPKRTRRKVRIPPNPGPEVCSPLAAQRNSESCLPPTILERLAGGSKKTRKQLINDLAKQYGCKGNSERCIVERSNLPYREKKQLLGTYFRPPMPKEWKSDPDQWLNSDDIAKVMTQYEKAYPDFRFLGVVPIDFSAADPYQKEVKKCLNDQFCQVNLKEEMKRGKYCLGAVFNLDPHYKGGSHWVGLFIDMRNKSIYYFDSYGMYPPKEIEHYMKYLTIQDPSLKLQSNGRRFQYSNSECGMYSMYFIIRMVEGESFKKFCKKRIPDDYMLKFRKVLFDPNAA